MDNVLLLSNNSLKLCIYEYKSNTKLDINTFVVLLNNYIISYYNILIVLKNNFSKSEGKISIIFLEILRLLK